MVIQKFAKISKFQNIMKMIVCTFDCSNSPSAIDCSKSNHVVNLIRALTIWLGLLLLKLAFRKLKPLFIFWSFHLPRFSLITNIPSNLALNTVIMSGLVLEIAAWICWIATKSNIQGYWLNTCYLWTLGSSMNCSQCKSLLELLYWKIII